MRSSNGETSAGGSEVHTFRVEGERFALIALPTLASARLASLTPAERAVVTATILGQSNLAIARARGVSARTVANQVASAFAKLGVRSRSELRCTLAMKRRDPVAVLEAAYSLGGTDEDWLRGVRDAAAPELDAGFGVMACLFHLYPDTGWGYGTVLTDGCDEALLAGFRAAMTDSEWERNAVAFLKTRALSCCTMSQQFGRAYHELRSTREHLLPNGIRDMLVIVVVNPLGPSCGLNVALPRVTRLGPRAVRRWSRIAAHLAAGMRVRRALANSGDALDGAEAILDPDGTLLHAAPPATAKDARAHLRRSVRALDRARGPLRRADPDEALAIWRGLCAGRWSLVDHVDRDGKRFLLARRNDPAVAPLAPLTLQERQAGAYAALGHSNKLIAYELGLGEAAVAMRLSRAARKLGAKSRAELVRRLRERLFAGRAPRRDVKK